MPSVLVVLQYFTWLFSRPLLLPAAWLIGATVAGTGAAGVRTTANGRTVHRRSYCTVQPATDTPAVQ